MRQRQNMAADNQHRAQFEVEREAAWAAWDAGHVTDLQIVLLNRSGPPLGRRVLKYRPPAKTVNASDLVEIMATVVGARSAADKVVKLVDHLPLPDDDRTAVSDEVDDAIIALEQARDYLRQPRPALGG